MSVVSTCPLNTIFSLRNTKFGIMTRHGEGIFQAAASTAHNMGPRCRCLWHAPLQVHSATSRQQPTQWSVLSLVDCFSPCQFVGVQVLLNHFDPRDARSISSSLQVVMQLQSAWHLYCHPFSLFRSTGSDEVTICLASILSSIQSLPVYRQ